MLWIDDKYANIIGNRLRNFKRKDQYLYQMSCPVCGDSSKSKTKARLYVYRQSHGLFVKCHKCQYSTTLGNLIKHVDSNIYSDYVLERYKTGNHKYVPHTDITEVIPSLKSVTLEDEVLSKLKRVDKIPDTHYASKYLASRKIPKELWKLFYYTPKFFKYVNDNIKYQFTDSLLKIDHPRLIIPFFNTHGKCFALQGRAFGKEIPRYITIKVDETEDKIFGLERIDYSKPILITEGPIDSLFLPNAIAVSGSNFDMFTLRTIMTNATIVPDNERRHKDVVKIIEKNIKLGYKVVLWPDTYEEKDINEMIVSGRTPEDILDTIKNNTYSGLEAEARFATWKKV
ncbi:DNA primase [uncultured Caudovirales phage]|uniref:DNA primase n=1 Tax=uncultured Caudovirales phage TaxID=2100421 RepID=A0A6J5KY20_9CAUD|nr:DNA primase [uncultured Caudovirales phage]